MLNSPKFKLALISIIKWLHFLNSCAEILQNFSVFFWKILDTRISFWDYLTFNSAQILSEKESGESRVSSVTLQCSNRKDPARPVLLVFCELPFFEVCIEMKLVMRSEFGSFTQLGENIFEIIQYFYLTLYDFIISQIYQFWLIFQKHS